MRLTTAGATDWRYLMIEDPIPAGTEPVQQERFYELERTRRDMWWWGSQREFRDDRVVFFLQGFDRGRYEFQYLLKVTSLGTFRASPSRISAMYVPEGTASSAAQSVTIEPPSATGAASNGGRQ